MGTSSAGGAQPDRAHGSVGVDLALNASAVVGSSTQSPTGLASRLNSIARWCWTGLQACRGSQSAASLGAELQHVLFGELMGASRLGEAALGAGALHAAAGKLVPPSIVLACGVLAVLRDWLGMAEQAAETVAQQRVMITVDGMPSPAVPLPSLQRRLRAIRATVSPTLCSETAKAVLVAALHGPFAVGPLRRLLQRSIALQQVLAARAASAAL